MYIIYTVREVQISIHALREEGDILCNCRKKGDVLISIHALREEGDGATVAEATAKYEISIHALREEGDCPTGHRRPSWQNFYPRPPRGGRRTITYHSLQT